MSRNKIPQLVQIFPDTPPGKTEKLSFDFEGLALTLAELAWNPANSTPFTSVVRGTWGRGKTTLLQRTYDLLEGSPGGAGEPNTPDRRTVRCLWFNAWKYPSEDTVLAGLLGALLDRMRQGGLKDQMKLLIDRNKDQLAVLALKTAASWCFGFAGTKLSEADRYSRAEEKRAFYDQFKSLFVQASYLLFHDAAALRDTAARKWEDLWNEERQRKFTLAIFLDDLDRCPQSRVLEVLEAVNLFLDLPGVCFYLGVDWDKLVEQLPKPFRDEKANFMEKIVQIALNLPDINPKGVERYIGELLKDNVYLKRVIGSDAEAVSQLLETDNRYPRHVKRFLNDLSMRLAILRNTRKLGDKSPKVPPRAVLAWHLLHEVKPQGWKEAYKLIGNLRPFLKKRLAKEQEKTEASEEEQERIMADAQAGQQDRLLPYVEVLEGLDNDQLNTLMHLGSPPVDETPKAPSVIARRGKHPLEPEWVTLEGGSFRMGAEDLSDRERPVHEVTLSPFKIARYPVTNAAYREYVHAGEAQPPQHWEKGEIPEGKENHPVVIVSWEDAVAYCKWLNEKLGLKNDARIHLPTEAQWEFAAAGVAGIKYPWGDAEPDERRANFGMSIGDTTPVDAYPAGATPEGVIDLAGNVLEWCQDWYSKYPDQQQTDPLGPDTGESRVLRGGSFYDGPEGLRCAYRYGYAPGGRYGYVGFRVVLSPFSSSER